jgi:O-antigen/teichoic acid export membrane protein
MNTGDIRSLDEEITTTAKSAGIVFFGTVSGSFLRYLFQIIIARHLGTDLFGLFFVGLAVYNVGSMVAAFGLPIGTVRYVAIYDGEKDKKRIKGTISAAGKLAALSGIIVSAFIFFFSTLISKYFFHNENLSIILKLFALVIPLTNLTTIFVSSSQGFKVLSHKVKVREFLEPSVRLTAVIIFFIFGWMLNGVILAYLISSALGAVCAFYLLKKIFPEISDKTFEPRRETRKLLSFSWPLLFINFFGLVMLWTDTIMLAYFTTAQDVGIYSAAQRTALLGSIVIVSFVSIFSPIISDLYNKGKTGSLNSYLKAVTKWIFTLCFPVYLILIYSSRSILSLFGKPFIQGSASLIILCAGWIVYSSASLSGQMIVMTGRQKLQLINMIGILTVNIVLNLILIPKFQIQGAAAATSISLVLFSILEIAEILLIFKITPFRKDFLKPLCAGTISLAALFALSKIGLPVSKGIVMPLVISSVLFLVFYAFTIFIAGLQEEDKYLLNKIKAKIFQSGGKV